MPMRGAEVSSSPLYASVSVIRRRMTVPSSNRRQSHAPTSAFAPRVEPPPALASLGGYPVTASTA